MSSKNIGEVHVDSGNIVVTDSINFHKYSELEFEEMFERHKENGYLLDHLPGDGIYPITGNFSVNEVLLNIQIPTMIYGFQYEEDTSSSSIVVGKKITDINCRSGFIGINDPVNWKIYQPDKEGYEVWNSFECPKGPGKYPIHEMILKYKKNNELVDEVYGYIIDLTTGM